MSIEQDYNTLKSNAFTFMLQRIPETAFRVTACNLPTINVPQPDENIPGATQFWAGTYTEFDEITLRFIVDENLKNYRELYNWITRQRYASSTIEVPNNQLEEDFYSDGALITLTNAANPNIIIRFIKMFPVSLGEVSFDVSTTPPTPVSTTVTFRYSYFKFSDE